MNRFVKTALAIAVAGSAANAGTGDNEWTALDSEITGLASSLKPPQDGMGWSLLLRGVYTHSSDDISSDPVSGADNSGFNFNDVDVAFWGTYGDYSARISADIDDNLGGQGFSPGSISGADLTLEDAYIRWACGEYFDATMGQFKPRISRSNSVDPEHLLFIDRSVIGSAGDWWDNGIGAAGTWEMVNWYAAVMNASNGKVSDHFYLVRGEYNVGSGAGLYEGAMGSTDQLNATFGASFFADDTIGDLDTDGDSDNTAFLFDAHGSISQFGFGGEVAFFDDDFAAFTDEDWSNISDGGGGIPALFLDVDSTPWSIYGSYLLNEQWEFGLRYEDLDNSENFADNTVISAVANWYQGTTGKWQVQWTNIDADSSFPDGNIIEIGYTVGATR